MGPKEHGAAPDSGNTKTKADFEEVLARVRAEAPSAFEQLEKLKSTDPKRYAKQMEALKAVYGLDRDIGRFSEALRRKCIMRALRLPDSEQPDISVPDASAAAFVVCTSTAFGATTATAILGAAVIPARDKK